MKPDNGRDMTPAELDAFLRKMPNIEPTHDMKKRMDVLLKDATQVKRPWFAFRHMQMPVFQIPFEAAYVLNFARAAAVLAIVFVMVYGFAPVSPVAANIKGTVKIFRVSTNTWQVASAGTVKLGRGDVLKTFEQGEADLVVPRLYHIRLKDDTEIRLASLPSRFMRADTEIELKKGRAFVNYNKDRTWGGALTVRTAQADATCLGTDFMIQSVPFSDKTWVGVLDGLVKVNSAPGQVVQAKASSVYVKPGEKTVVFTGGKPAAPERLAHDELMELQELYGLGAKQQVALIVSNGPMRTRDMLEVTSIYVSSGSADDMHKKLESIIYKFCEADKTGSKEQHEENILHNNRYWYFLFFVTCIYL